MIRGLRLEDRVPHPVEQHRHQAERDEERERQHELALERERAREVATATLGDELWARYEREGYLDVPSTRFPGIAYRLRAGRRIEVLRSRGVKSPWYYDFLCINPTYPLPEEEFLAQLYLYIRDQEDEVVRVAAPQPWDQALGRTF